MTFYFIDHLVCISLNLVFQQLQEKDCFLQRKLSKRIAK